MSNSTTLAVLAGGEGLRMGKPKGELLIHGKPILLHLMESLNWKGPKMLVTAPGREHPAGCERFDAEAVDPVKDQGPLRGVLTALEHATTETVLILPVDMLYVKPQQLHWLDEQLLERPAALGIMTRRKGGSAEFIEPFPLAARVGARQLISRRLSNGQLSIRALLDEPRFLTLNAPMDWSIQTWTSLNTPDDVQRFIEGVDVSETP